MRYTVDTSTENTQITYMFLRNCNSHYRYCRVLLLDISSSFCLCSFNGSDPWYLSPYSPLIQPPYYYCHPYSDLKKAQSIILLFMKNPFYEAKLLIRPEFYSPLVTVLMGFYSVSSKVFIPKWFLPASGFKAGRDVYSWILDIIPLKVVRNYNKITIKLIKK